MRKRKLQIFLSSTYEDLVDHRLAAMEAILAAGHIPAAMEQFPPGDETAWEKIKAWIDESDAFILILGGRYGSVEPVSGKSYVQLEYEYAIEKKKPFFALVISDKHHEERVKQYGLIVHEDKNPEKYKVLKGTVTQRLCRFWNDKKDIEAAIFQKLPEWAQRDDLIGWVRGDEATNPQTANELARLSQENRELRAQASTETFAGLGFEELVKLLEENKIGPVESVTVLNGLGLKAQAKVRNLLDLFQEMFRSQGAVEVAITIGHSNLSEAEEAVSRLEAFGLLEKEEMARNGSGWLIWRPSEAGQRLRNRLVAYKRSQPPPQT